MDTAEERQKSGKEEIVRRLEQYPEVKARVLRLLDMVENTDSDLKRADEAEQRTIEELRRTARAGSGTAAKLGARTGQR